MEENIKVGDLVKVLDKDGTQIHRGIAVKTTTKGAFVYQRRKNPTDNDGDVGPETCGWWPYSSKEFRISLITPAERLKI